MTAFFNFRDECRTLVDIMSLLPGDYKFDVTVYNAFMDCFDTLSLAAVINGRFLGVHGGISPALPQTRDIKLLNRFQEPPRAGLFW